MTASRTSLLVAFATVYLVWGSSYLFIKFAVETMPPVTMAGSRYFIAGVILTVGARFARASWPTSSQWGAAALVGLGLMGSNAGVAWSERRVPSGVASLLIATTPCFMLLMDWMRDRKARPRAGVFVGLALGLVGVGFLIGPGQFLGAQRIDLLGALALLGSAVTWSAASLYSRHAPRPESAIMMSGAQMLAGGLVLSLIAGVAGDWSSFSLDAVSARSWIAYAYLVLVASLLGFTAYVYVLRHTTPARATTYAFVNPVVAVALGSLFGGEPLSARVLVAMLIIVTAVAIIVSFSAARAGATSAAGTAPSRA